MNMLVSIYSNCHVPVTAEVSTEISTTSTITNTQGTANTVSSDMRTLQRIEQTVDEGQHCELLLESKSCQINGKGALKMVAQGLLWFQYEKRTQGHYKVRFDASLLCLLANFLGFSGDSLWKPCSLTRMIVLASSRSRPVVLSVLQATSAQAVVLWARPSPLSELPGSYTTAPTILAAEWA